jgi:hypothetical protein
MAILLYRYIRGKYRENKAAKVTTSDESHLMPEISSSQEPKQHEQANRLGDNISVTPIQRPVEHTSTTSAANPKENIRSAAEASQRRKKQWKLTLGLVLSNFLAAADVTIVAPAIPIISSHFGMSRAHILIDRANSQRPTRWQLQLDRRRLHTDLYSLRADFGPNS